MVCNIIIRIIRAAPFRSAFRARDKGIGKVGRKIREKKWKEERVGIRGLIVGLVGKTVIDYLENYLKYQRGIAEKQKGWRLVF